MNTKVIKGNEDLGQIFTPALVSDLMAKLLLKYNPKKIIDPAVGMGALLKAVLINEPDANILGYDVDENLIDQLSHEGYIVEHKDFFDYTEKVDGIIVNPPYIRQEKLKSEKEFLNKECILKKIKSVTISSKANLYLYFFVKTLQALTDNGTVVTIMPNTWLTSSFGRSVQKEVLENFSIETIVNFSDNVFKGYDVDASIMAIKNTKPDLEQKLEIFDVFGEITEENINEILSGKVSSKNLKVSAVRQKNIEENRWYSYRESSAFQFENFVKLSDIFSISRGLSTNSNSFFILDNNDFLVLNHPDFFKKIINKPQDIAGYNATENLAKKSLFYTQLSKYELPKELQDYVEDYEKNAISVEEPKTLLSKMRNNPNTWFSLNRNVRKGIIFSYIIRDNAKFIYKDNDLLVKDNFYELEAHSKIDLFQYIAILNSTFTKYFMEQYGRSYGSGLLKIQKYEIDILPLIELNLVSENDQSKLHEFGEEMINGHYSDALILKIDSLLEKYYLTSNENLSKFYGNYDRIVSSRKGAKK